jgi:hypothetical protein
MCEFLKFGTMISINVLQRNNNKGMHLQTNITRVHHHLGCFSPLCDQRQDLQATRLIQL